jgi:hypothetical protein
MEIPESFFMAPRKGKNFDRGYAKNFQLRNWDGLHFGPKRSFKSTKDFILIQTTLI